MTDANDSERLASEFEAIASCLRTARLPVSQLVYASPVCCGLAQDVQAVLLAGADVAAGLEVLAGRLASLAQESPAARTR
jgi:hypothetical protein